MNEILTTLLHTTLILTLCGVVCFLALRKVESRLPRLSRLLWLAVLLTGWFWLHPSIQITTPHLAGTPASPTDVSVAQHEPIVETAPVFQEPFEGAGVPAKWEDEKISVAKKFEWRRLILPTVFAIWLGGIFMTTILAAVGYVRILLLLRNTVPAGDDFAGPWRRLLEEQGISSQTIPMLLSRDLGPALIRTPLGYRLVVPEELWSELSEAGRCGILKHEREHFRRRDVWKSFFVRILALPHWFNPMVHLAVHRFEEAAELLCDRAAFDVERSGVFEFAETLLLLHENAPTRFVVRQSIFGRGLKHRVACLLRDNNEHKVSPMKRILLIGVATIILAAALFRVEFVAKTVAQSPPNEPGPVVPTNTTKPPILAQDRPDVRVYAVNKLVKNFPETEDNSTPEAEIASLIRIEDDLGSNPGVSKDASQSAEILEVRIFRDKYAMVLVNISHWKYMPFSLSILEKKTNGWSRLSGERLETIEMFAAKFAGAVKRWEKSELGQWVAPNDYQSTHLVVLAPKGDFKPKFMTVMRQKLAPLWKRSNDLSLTDMKTWPENDDAGHKTLVVGFLVNDPEAIREIVAKEIPDLFVQRVETLNDQIYKDYTAGKSRNLNGQISSSDATQNTHVVVFTGKDDFKPKTVGDILIPVSQAMRKMPSGNNPLLAAGWTKSWVEDGRLVGALLTNDPELMEKVVDELPGHQVLRSEKLTDESLRKYLERVSTGLK